MRKKHNKTPSIIIIMLSLIFWAGSCPAAFAADTSSEPFEIVENAQITGTGDISAESEPEPVYPLTDEEISFIAQVTMAEVEGQSEFCKRLVIDSILNRVDDSRFPDTVYDVVYAKNQFEVMVNGRFERCYAREDIVELVKEELINRTDAHVIFFNSIGFNDWSVPMYQEGDMYFSACQ